jgi:hypothetical protein
MNEPTQEQIKEWALELAGQEKDMGWTGKDSIDLWFDYIKTIVQRDGFEPRMSLSKEQHGGGVLNAHVYVEYCYITGVWEREEK